MRRNAALGTLACAWLSACSSGGSGSTAPPNLPPPPPTNIAGVVVVDGLAQVDSTLSATVTDANGLTNSVLAYQWEVDGNPIATATLASYTLTSAETGGIVRVQVSYTDDDSFSETLLSVGSNPVLAAPVPTGPGNFPRGTVGDNDSVPPIDCDTVVSSTSELENLATRTMSAGETLCLSPGNYTDLALDFGGQGTEALPIKVAAEVPGTVVVAGRVQIRMSGEYVMLQGLVFQDATSASGDFLQTRSGSRDPCHFCRVVDNAFVAIDEPSSPENKWVNIYGQFCRVDHNWFAGKTNAGALLVVTREVPDGGVPQDTEIDYAQIDHNYFGDRAPADGKAYADGSDNGYEAIRLGTSDSHSADSFSVLEYNYFERIDGESEVISNKSGSNRLFNNTIRDSFGSLTMRHGAQAQVERNFILGDGHPFAGGIRVIDDGHRIVNNYIDGTRYVNSNFHGGIVLHASDGSTTNGYQILTNVFVANNTITDAVNSLNVNGGTRTINPENVVFANNVIADAIGPVITKAGEGMPANSTYAGNYVFGKSFSDNAAITSLDGFSFVDSRLIKDALGLRRVSPSSPPIVAETAFDMRDFDPVAEDMDGQARDGQTDSGADHVSTEVVLTGLLNRFDVGPMAYAPPVTAPVIARIALSNAEFDDGAAGWVVTPPATVTTSANQTFSRGASIRVDDGTGRFEQSVALEPNRRYELSAFTEGPARLGVLIDGSETSADDNNSSYRLTRLTFDSGASASVTVFATRNGGNNPDDPALFDGFRLVAYPGP